MPFVGVPLLVSSWKRQSLEIETCGLLFWSRKLRNTAVRSTQFCCALALMYMLHVVCSWFKSVFAVEPLSPRLGSTRVPAVLWRLS